MFECERCGSGYSASHLGVEHCPRCQLRDQVQAPLVFKAFQRTQARAAVVDSTAQRVAAESLSQAPAEAR